MNIAFCTMGYMVVFTALGLILFLVHPAVTFLLGILDEISRRFRRGPRYPDSY